MNAIPPKSLVLIVGAGASKEVNLPVGSELRTMIANTLDIRYEDGYRRGSGDGIVDEAFRALARFGNSDREDINPYLHASWRIRDAMPQAISIDNFIDSHRGDERIATCGKLAITRCILTSEKNSELFVNRNHPYPRINFAGVQHTWLNALFQLLSENCEASEIGTRLAQVAIVCFNYDRCIEHYLHGALQNYYGMNADLATRTMANLQVFHPYGAVGQLPWQQRVNGVDFGADTRGQSLLEISKGIRTFTEGVNPETSSIVEIRQSLASARRIAFLGFAFHRLNLQLLFPGLADGQQIMERPSFATGYGLSEADATEIRRELGERGAVLGNRFQLRRDLKCAELFREFGRSLSLHLM